MQARALSRLEQNHYNEELALAVIEADIDGVNCNISKQANVNYVTSRGITPLMYAALASIPKTEENLDAYLERYLQIIKILRNAGATINTQNNRGQTALMLVGFKPCNGDDNFIYTLQGRRIDWGRAKIVAILLSLYKDKIDLTIKDKQGKDAQSYLADDAECVALIKKHMEENPTILSKSDNVVENTPVVETLVVTKEQPLNSFTYSKNIIFFREELTQAQKENFKNTDRVRTILVTGRKIEVPVEYREYDRQLNEDGNLSTLEDPQSHSPLSFEGNWVTQGGMYDQSMMRREIDTSLTFQEVQESLDEQHSEYSSIKKRI